MVCRGFRCHQRPPSPLIKEILLLLKCACSHLSRRQFRFQQPLSQPALRFGLPCSQKRWCIICSTIAFPPTLSGLAKGLDVTQLLVAWIGKECGVLVGGDSYEV